MERWSFQIVRPRLKSTDGLAPHSPLPKQDLLFVSGALFTPAKISLRSW